MSVVAVAVAVATVAVVVTGLDGFESFARDSAARAFGSDSFVVAQVIPAQLSRRELAERLERNPPLRLLDVKFLNRYASPRVLYSVISQRRGSVVRRGKEFEGASISGSDASMFQIRELGISSGRFFLDSEADSAAQVVVLGADVAGVLFPAEDPLGHTVRIGGRGFRVVGVQQRQGTAGGVSLDRYVWIPYRSFQRVFGTPASLRVFARPGSGSNSVQAEDLTRVTMRARRRLQPGARDTFDLLSPEAARSFVVTVSTRISAAAGPISLMALLAAVLVVTNTSLVSVSQRTREIGIRRAVGAARRRIMWEVVAESFLVALFGGIVGVLLAAAVVSAAETFLELNLKLVWPTVAVGLLAAGLSGLVAGLYPAQKAARIEVIGALHVE